VFVLVFVLVFVCVCMVRREHFLQACIYVQLWAWWWWRYWR